MTLYLHLLTPDPNVIFESGETHGNLFLITWQVLHASCFMDMEPDAHD